MRNTCRHAHSPVGHIQPHRAGASAAPAYAFPKDGKHSSKVDFGCLLSACWRSDASAMVHMNDCGWGGWTEPNTETRKQPRTQLMPNASRRNDITVRQSNIRRTQQQHRIHSVMRRNRKPRWLRCMHAWSNYTQPPPGLHRQVTS